jgi:transcriptional antiterminator RfaH
MVHHTGGPGLCATRRPSVDSELCWVLLYTKPRAESWAEINLRRQGYETLLPRIRSGHTFAPLFPRYLFAAYRADQPSEPLRNTRGVHSVVQFGAHPARVPESIIQSVRARMDGQGIVTLELSAPPDPLFVRAQRQRVRALVKFAQAGFRVVA